MGRVHVSARGNYEDDPASGLTAVISILKNEQRGSRKVDSYSIAISFLGPTLLPPFLPRISCEGSSDTRKEIASMLAHVAKCYGSHMLLDEQTDGTEGGEELLESMRRVGSLIGGYLVELRMVLRKLPELGVRHVIFHTDEYEIPWPLALIQVPGFPELRFCCELFTCGTVLLDREEMAFERLTHYMTSSRQPSVSLRSKGDICLFGASFGVTDPDSGADLGDLYLEHLQSYLAREGGKLGLDVRSYGASDWRELSHTHHSPVFFLREKVKRAQVIHITAHVDEKAVLHFSEDIRVSPRELEVDLAELVSRPLVVLHGCSTGHVHAIRQNVAQLSRIFLEKGASGCVACLLPVSISLAVSAGVPRPWGFVELMYKNIFDIKPYGQALLDARTEFKRAVGSERDPQWLFFHLYGDPRARVVSATALTVTKVLDVLRNAGD